MDFNKIETHLDNTVFGHPFIYKRKTGSTNNDLLLMAKSGAKEGTVIAAGYQTAGRGTRGEKWLAAPYENMSLSLLCRPKLPVFASLKMTLLAAIILRHAILTFPGFGTMIQPSIKFKWPNDLVVGKKKLAGILLESNVRNNQIDAVVAGFGLNINADSKKLSKRLDKEAVSLVDLFGTKIDVADFCLHFLQVFETLYIKYFASNLASVVQDWELHSAFPGARLKLIHGNEISEGLYAGLDDKGLLCYNTPSGVKKIISGRVIDWL